MHDAFAEVVFTVMVRGIAESAPTDPPYAMHARWIGGAWVDARRAYEPGSLPKLIDERGGVWDDGCIEGHEPINNGFRVMVGDLHTVSPELQRWLLS